MAEDYELEVLTGMPMSRLRQTIKGREVGGRPGDCFRTALACLLDAPDPTSVPHFVEKELDLEATGRPAAHEHWRLARLWLRAEFVIDLGSVAVDTAVDLDVPYLLSVPSHKGPWGHVVIARGQDVIWDPSGLDDYRFDEHETDTGKVLVRPYAPGPNRQVAAWRAQDLADEQVAS